MQDAATAVANFFGVKDWEWGGTASYKGFVEYVYKNCKYVAASGIVSNDETSSILISYLVECGENISDYGLEILPDYRLTLAQKTS